MRRDGHPLCPGQHASKSRNVTCLDAWGLAAEPRAGLPGIASEPLRVSREEAARAQNRGAGELLELQRAV